MAKQENSNTLENISTTLDAILTLMLAERAGGTFEVSIDRESAVSRKIARLMGAIGFASINDGTFPKMDTGRGMGIPDVRLDGEMWHAYPVAGDTFVTAADARDIKEFAGGGK